MSRLITESKAPARIQPTGPGPSLDRLGRLESNRDRVRVVVAHGQAWLDNSATYMHAKSTSYVETPYHTRRRTLAARLLHDALSSLGSSITGPILEIGAGASGITLDKSVAADAQQRKIIYADISEEALGNLQMAGVPALRFDASFPFPIRTASLSAVVTAELIEHLYDPRAFLKEIGRAVKPGGVLVLTTPNMATLQDRIRFALGRSPRQVDPRHSYLRLHIRPMTKWMLKMLLDDAKFDLVDVTSNYLCLKWRGLGIESRTLARMFSRPGRFADHCRPTAR